MPLALMITGAMAILAGPVLLYFGYVSPSDIGSNYYVMSTMALLGGMALLGLSEVVKQLRRIAEGAPARAFARSPRDLFEPDSDVAEPVVPPPAAMPRVPFPPKVEPRKRAPVPAAEPHFDMAPPIDGGGAPFERPAPAFERAAPAFERSAPAFARLTPEPRVLPERDEAPEAPLSPAQARFSASRDEKDDLAEGLLATAFSRLDVSMRPAPPAAEPVAPAPEKASDNMFESMWPAERRAAEPEPMHLSGELAHSDMHMTDMHMADMPMTEPALEETQPEPEQPEAPYAVSILKSGVVDGMAYTLYSDGSIEAEMPQGTMRFASIHELRGYLENSSS